MISASRILAVSCALALALVLAGCESSGTSSSNVRVYGSIYYGYGYYNPWYWRHYWYRPPYWGPPGYRPPVYRPPRPENPIYRPPGTQPVTRPERPVADRPSTQPVQRPADTGREREPKKTIRRASPVAMEVKLLAMEALGYGCRDNGLIFSMNAHLWSGALPIWRRFVEGATGMSVFFLSMAVPAVVVPAAF